MQLPACSGGRRRLTPAASGFSTPRAAVDKALLAPPASCRARTCGHCGRAPPDGNCDETLFDDKEAHMNVGRTTTAPLFAAACLALGAFAMTGGCDSGSSTGGGSGAGSGTYTSGAGGSSHSGTSGSGASGTSTGTGGAGSTGGGATGSGVTNGGGGASGIGSGAGGGAPN
jgi:hypothetical protein